MALLLVAGVLAILLSRPGYAANPDPEPRRSMTRTPAPPAPATPEVTRRPAPSSAAVPILMYHYISEPGADTDRLRRDLSVAPVTFEAQLRFLRENGYTSVGLDQVHANLTHGTPLPAKPVVLTFDDGYLDHYTHAFPLLKRYGMTGTFFIVTDFINYKNPDYVTWRMVREMHEAGMSIQSHGRTHIDLRRRSNAVLVWELLGPVEQIEAYTGERPRFFCYPAGRYDASVIRILRDLGMLAAVTTEAGRVHRLETAMIWQRLRVRGGLSLDQFERLVNSKIISD